MGFLGGRGGRREKRRALDEDVLNVFLQGITWGLVLRRTGGLFSSCFWKLLRESRGRMMLLILASFTGASSSGHGMRPLTVRLPACIEHGSKC